MSSRRPPLAGLLLLAACQGTVTESLVPVSLSAVEAGQPVRRLVQDTVPALQSGHIKNGLTAGSRWQAVGRIPQGVVYRPLDDVLLVVATNAHEGYLVVSEGSFAGVYLPYDESFLPAASMEPLEMENAGP